MFILTNPFILIIDELSIRSIYLLTLKNFKNLFPTYEDCECE